MPPTSNLHDALRVVIVGAGGYSGAELLSILLGHPGVSVVGLFGSEKRGAGAAAQTIDEVFPRFRGLCDLPIESAGLDEILALNPAAVFLATPIGVSHDLAPALIKAGIVVLDVSAAFRLKDRSLYEKHYGFEHAHPEALSRAVYGLPELFREAIRSADLIALPGCYPTSAVLPLAPLIKAGALVRGRRPIVDSVSGVSGAGRSASLKTHFCEVSLQPYEVLSHRHTPEIAAYAGVAVVFTPHLVALDRGILSTIHGDLGPGWNRGRVVQALEAAYASEPFIRFLPEGQWPSVGAVRGTNFCDIGCAVDPSDGHLILISAIDNLVKGAAGQGVQCLNIRFGLPEHAGLLPIHGQAVPS